MTKTLRHDFELMCEVISLSRRLDVKAALSQVTTDNCIRLFHIFSIYGCAQKPASMLFLVRRLNEVGQSPDLKTISVEDLERFVTSKAIFFSVT